MNLTTSKTQHFCETSPVWTWQRQKRSNSARLPSKMESCVQRWRPRTNAFCNFPIHLSRLPRTSDARSYEVLHLSRKIISANLKIWCSKMQPFSGHQRKMHLCRSSSNLPRLPLSFEMLQNPHVLLTFNKVHNPLRLPRESASERQKVVLAWQAWHFAT